MRDSRGSEANQDVIPLVVVKLDLNGADRLDDVRKARYATGKRTRRFRAPT